MVFVVVRGLYRFMRRWMDQVRDEHFLVGRRLHNVAQTVATPVAEANGD
jgi:hypothetical protein